MFSANYLKDLSNLNSDVFTFGAAFSGQLLFLHPALLTMKKLCESLLTKFSKYDIIYKSSDDASLISWCSSVGRAADL